MHIYLVCTTIIQHGHSGSGFGWLFCFDFVCCLCDSLILWLAALLWFCVPVCTIGCGPRQQQLKVTTADAGRAAGAAGV